MTHNPTDDYGAALARLEDGAPDLANPPVLAEVQPPTHAATVERWARAVGLRPGLTPAPCSRALLPVIAAWCEARGWEGPAEPRAVGVGLGLAGIQGRKSTGGTRAGARQPLVRREDAARLYRLARAAWDGQHMPGEPHVRRPPRRRSPTGLKRGQHHPRPPPPLFHSEQPRRTRAVVDSLGRVYPSAALAARMVGGSAGANLGRVLVGKGWNGWRGLHWRYLTPAERAAVPPEARAGDAVPGLAWGLVCPHCGGAGVPAVR